MQNGLQSFILVIFLKYYHFIFSAHKKINGKWPAYMLKAMNTVQSFSKINIYSLIKANRSCQKNTVS